MYINLNDNKLYKTNVITNHNRLLSLNHIIINNTAEILTHFFIFICVIYNILKKDERIFKEKQRQIQRGFQKHKQTNIKRKEKIKELTRSKTKKKQITSSHFQIQMFNESLTTLRNNEMIESDCFFSLVQQIGERKQ